MEDDIKFIDAESYQGKNQDNKLTFKQIVLEYIRKIGNYSSVEFRGGYYDVRENQSGMVTNITKTYIPDSREVYSNSIEYLYDILYPHFDQEMKDSANKIFEEKKAKIEEISKEDNDNQNERILISKAKRESNRNLFRELNCFLFRQKYMEGKTFNDEA